MEHHTTGSWRTAGSGASADEAARFLRELRQLRDVAGLEQIELAVRAHYPHDYIRAAEAGPALPDLPLLDAYVRGCGGTTEEWEERWRALTNTPALTLLPTRSAGASTAASAGSRLGQAFQSEDAPDPAAIMAALNRVAEKIATEPVSPPLVETGLVGAPPWAAAEAASAPDAATAMAAAPVPALAPAAKGPGKGPTAGKDPDPGTSAVAGRPGRSFSLTSRATIAALIALAICIVVAVLAIFT